MHTFRVTKEIAAPVDRVWALLDDFANTYVYHPLVEKSVSVNGKTTGLDAERQCTMYGGASVKERIVEYDPGDRWYRIGVTDMGPFPLKHMDVTVSVQAVDFNRSEVTYIGTMQPKFGPMGWMMAKTMMLPRFKKMMGQLIDGVESHLQTGRIIEKGGALGPALERASAPV